MPRHGHSKTQKLTDQDHPRSSRIPDQVWGLSDLSRALPDLVGVLREHSSPHRAVVLQAIEVTQAR